MEEDLDKEVYLLEKEVSDKMAQKSLDELKKEIKSLEKNKKDINERMKLETKLKSLKSPSPGSRIKKVVTSKRARKVARGIGSAFDRAGRNFGFS